MSQHTDIKTYDDACKATGRDPNVLPDVSPLPESDRDYLIAYYMLTVIAEALRGDWRPDWTDYDQGKYYPWFEVEADKERPAGFGFSLTHYGSTYTSTYVGSRLCYPSAKIAMYAGEQFKELYLKTHLLNK
jgi:hypothetical protein